MIRKLHHNACRGRDSEARRRCHEDFLGLPMVEAVDIEQNRAGRQTKVLRSFYRLDDGSHRAFFEAPDVPFEFKVQHDFGLHIAFEVDASVLPQMLGKGRAHGVETRGVSHHGFIDSIDLRDPGGYVIELCAKLPGHDAALGPAKNGVHAKLERRTQARRRA
jgi:catechol 2,3-dioxygenase-like lactoylglutathione lyase family enzyme